MMRHTVSALLLLMLTAHARADWREVYHADFNTPGWETAWNFRGTPGATDQGALITGGNELIATLDKTFNAPAIRAEFDATFTATGKGGEISDLSCFLDGVFFQVGGNNNTRTRIRHAPLQSTETAADLQMNKTVRITAEVNGLAARLSIDGKPVVSMLTQPKRDDDRFSFYTWTGIAQFDNLRIFVKDEADPLPADLKDAKERGYQTPQTLKHLRDWTLPTVDEPKPAAIARERVELHIDAGPHERTIDWPITMGVPLPKQTLWNPDQARVIDETGREIPSQRTVTATWTRGGSIRWLLLDFVLPKGDAPSKLFLEYGNQVSAAAVPNPVTVNRDDDAIEVTSGSLTVAFNRNDGAVLDGIYLNGRKVVDRAEAFYVTTKGDRYSTFGDDDELAVDVEMAGPIRTVIRSRGWYRNDKGERACAFTRRIYVYRGLPLVRLFTTWTVTVDTNAYKFTEVALRFPLADATQSTPRMHLASQRNEGVIFEGGAEQTTDDLPDWITSNGVTLSCYEMSRQWPAALEATAGELVFHGYTNAAGRNLDMTLEGLKDVWGDQAYERFEANRKTYPSLTNRNANGCGIAKTHELILAFGEQGAIAGEMLQTPPIVSVDPAFACDTRVVGPGEYHPYDPKNFPEEEAAILKRYDEFLDAIDRLDPWYGWWDYGGGMPHYTSETADGRVIYTGYRRTYDMGYQRPMVPWNYYLRSGQRAWLTYAIRNARCMMDMHTQHWTNAPLNKHVGWVIADHGTWPWDSYLISWSFNHYVPYLLLNYYTTGYERAYDVMIEVMDEYYRDVGPGGGSKYCGRVGTWLGNTAAAYRATWDPRYLELYRPYEQLTIEQQCQFCKGIKSSLQTDEDHDHGYTHRAGWREYGFEQALQVPEHDPKLKQVYLEWAKTLRENNFRAPMQLLNFAMLRLYRAEGNPLDARLGYESLKENASYDMVPKYGLAHLRTLPAAMKLALVDGVDRIALPREREFPGNVYVHHEQGRETTFAVDIGDGGPDVADQPVPISIADLDGNVMPAGWMTLDAVNGKASVTMPAAHATSTWIVSTRRDGPLTVYATPTTPMMAAFPDGIQFDEAEPPTVWFNVPETARQFRVRSNLPGRTLTIVRPDGEEIAGEGEWTTADVPTDLTAGPWAIRSGHENPHAFYILKLYDIPAVVAFDRESVFDMADPPMPTPDYEGHPADAVFVDGAISGGQALLLNGRDRLTLPLGSATGVNSYERFDAQRGTIEFFFMLNEHPAFAKGTGIPFVVPLAPDSDFKTWLRAAFSFDFKNAFNLVERSGNTQRPIMLGPWNAQTGMLTLDPGRWHHVAIVWDADLPMPVNGRQKNKLMSKAFLNGEAALHRNIAYPRDPNPYWLVDGFTMPATADVIEMFSRNHNIVIDELRISRVPRAGFLDKTYPVPTSPHQRDADTLILMHFDGNTDFIGPHGETVSAPFMNQP